jgi:hypothetical protein
MYISPAVAEIQKVIKAYGEKRMFFIAQKSKDSGHINNKALFGN